MSRAELLSKSIEESTNLLVATAESLGEAEFKALCEEGGRAAGQIFYHLADAFGVTERIVRAMAAGESFSALTGEWIESRNASGADESKDYSKERVIDSLRTAGGQLAEVVRGLSEQQLDITGEAFAGAGHWTIELALQVLALGHTQSHLGAIQRALERASGGIDPGDAGAAQT